VFSRRYFGPPKDGRARSIELPVFLAGLLHERAEAAGGKYQGRFAGCQPRRIVK